MKLIHFILVFLLTSPAYSNSHVPLSFFAKVNGYLKPLFSVPHWSSHGVLQVMSYGLSQPDLFPPTEFIVQGSSVHTRETHSPEYVGLYSGFLSFSSFLPETGFDLDTDMRVRDKTYYSCEVFHHTIPSILTEKKSANCFEVELYIFAYDHVTKSAVKAVLSEIPMAFFVKFNGTLEPLSGINLGPDFGNFNLFVHRYPSAKPVEITFSDNFAVIRKPQLQDSEYVVLNEGRFEYGPNVVPAIIFLISEWRLLHGPFYSCSLSKVVVGSVRGKSRTVPQDYEPYCLEVEIYLRPYETIGNYTLTA